MFELSFVEGTDHLLDFCFIKFGNVLGQAICQFCCGGAQACCVDGDAGVGNFCEFEEVFRFVPDDIEISDDALDEVPGGPSAFSVFKG